MKQNTRHWLGILALLTVSVATVNHQYDADLGKTSLLSTPSHEAFDGTVYPLPAGMDWSHFRTEDYKKTYEALDEALLTDFPECSEEELTFPSADLIWGNAQHNEIRNAKITCSVAWAGSYALDDTGRGEGSHPAWDFKTLSGTPVLSIANGVVIESGYSSSGWGNHIVVKHEDVPSPDNPSRTTTLYSSYSHLSEIFIGEGEEVQKGEVIGKVGMTGTATTNHLHFQLDNEEAPYLPSWPFTSREASNAGLSFWDAVTEGLNQDNVYAWTYDGLDWVQDHLDESGVENEEEEATEEESTSTVPTSNPRVTLTGSEILALGSNNRLQMRLSQGWTGSMDLKISDESILRLETDSLSSSDFSGGKASLNIYAEREGSSTLQILFEGTVIAEKTFKVEQVISDFDHFIIESDGAFGKEKEVLTIKALDANGNVTPKFNGSNVELKVSEGSAALFKDGDPVRTLDSSDFTSGEVRVDLEPNKLDPITVELIYGTQSVKALLDPQLFSDLSDTHPFYKAVSYLVRDNTINGYPDGTFKPEQTVNRAEALTLIFKGLDQGFGGGNEDLPFSDVIKNRWYSPYVIAAYKRDIVVGYADGTFKPEQGVNRAEFLKILFTTLDIKIDPVLTEDPYEDVDRLSWYAPYVQYTKENDLFPTEGLYFEPGKAMSRIEVAEVIYRTIQNL